MIPPSKGCDGKVELFVFEIVHDFLVIFFSDVLGSLEKRSLEFAIQCSNGKLYLVQLFLSGKYPSGSLVQVAFIGFLTLKS